MTDDMLLYIVCPALLWIFIIIDFIHLNFKNKNDILKIVKGGDIMKYSPLGIKSEYTLLTSLIKISDLINFAMQNNITTIGLLDDNLNGVIEF